METENFRNTVLSLIDDKASMARSFIDCFNDVVNSFDMTQHLDSFNEMKRDIINRGNDLFEDFSSLMKQVKENLKDFTVTVPFNDSIGEKISYSVNDNKLIIEVKFEDSTTTRESKTSVLIPNNCDIENIMLTTDNVEKTATVTIPKIVKYNGCDDNVTSKETANESNESLATKSRKNAEKMYGTLTRDSRGRFVRRTPKNVGNDIDVEEKG